MEGLEPPRLAALDPKSRASANSATSALRKTLEIFCLNLYKAKRTYILLKTKSSKKVNHGICNYRKLYQV